MELLKLSIYDRMASLGKDYNLLNNIYPSWSFELHEYGDIMEDDKLELIAIYGIIHWYHSAYLKFDICYNYYDKLLDFINNPKNISYNDYINLNNLAKFAKIDLLLNIQNDTKYNELSSYYNKELFYKYATLPWSTYLIDKFGINNINIFLNKLFNYIQNNKEWFIVSYFDTFLDKCPEIKKLGILFQRNKIILEKKSKLNDYDIYKLDAEVEHIQQTIYSLCYYYRNKFNNTTNYI
jgi:hypothetical protein